MGILRMLGLSGSKTPAGRFFDFTYEVPGQVVTLVKHLDNARVFLVGQEPKLSVGDVVMVKPPRGQKGPTRFCIDVVQPGINGQWRAYGSPWP